MTRSQLPNGMAIKNILVLFISDLNAAHLKEEQKSIKFNNLLLLSREWHIVCDTATAFSDFNPVLQYIVF